MPIEIASMFQRGTPSVQEYMLECAVEYFDLNHRRRAELANGEIPSCFGPAGFHTRMIRETKAKIKVVEEWSDQEAFNIAWHEYYMTTQKAIAEKKARTNARIQIRVAIKEIKELELSPEHEELREFMLNDLYETLKRVGAQFSERPIRMSGQEYKAKVLKELNEKLEGHIQGELLDIAQYAELSEQWLDTITDLGFEATCTPEPIPDLPIMRM